MTYRAYIITTPLDKNDKVNTEYYPRQSLDNIIKKINYLNKKAFHDTSDSHLFSWKLKNKKIILTVIHNKTNKTVDATNPIFLDIY